MARAVNPRQSTQPSAHQVASEQTRHDLLAAGLRLLIRLPASATFGHLTAAKVATEAGRTTGAFFHQWESTEAYLMDLAAYVLRPEMSVNLPTTVEGLHERLAKGEDFGQALIEAGRRVPELTAEDPKFVTEILLWNRAMHDQAFRDQLEPLYRDRDEAAGEIYVDLLTLLGREPRPPFTPTTIGLLINAVAQGIALRESITPGAYPEEAFGWTVLALIPLLTREPGDGESADEFAASLTVDVVDAGTS